MKIETGLLLKLLFATCFYGLVIWDNLLSAEKWISEIRSVLLHLFLGCFRWSEGNVIRLGPYACYAYLIILHLSITNPSIKTLVAMAFYDLRHTEKQT